MKKLLCVALFALSLFCCLGLIVGCTVNTGNNGNGWNAVHDGNGGNNDDNQLDDYVEVTLVFNGVAHTDPFHKGDVVYFALTYSDMDVSLSADFSPLLGREEGVTIREGLIIYLRDKQQTPTQVVITYYDVDKDGTLETFERSEVRYGTTHTFSGAGFVLYRDQSCTQEIDPNEEFVLTENLSVYRKDNKDRSPVFVNVHYFINGIEYTGISGNTIYFRGELLRNSTYIIYDTDYVFYRDSGKTQPLFADGRVEVVRESDDKVDWYAFKDDPNMHKVTFMLGERELGTVLMYHNNIIGEYAATGLPGDIYIIRDCSAMNQPVTHDMTVNITDYDRYSTFAVTEHLCYNGDIKYTCVNYSRANDEENIWEITESDDPYSAYYLDVNCTQVFTGKVTSAKTFYRKLDINLDRYVGNR